MKETGGQAFPRSPHSGDASDDGMTLRDYFAAAVLQGIYASGSEGGWGRDQDRAERAYKQADAMLSERAK